MTETQRRIALLIEELGITQYKLAKTLGIERCNVYNWVRGISEPSAYNLSKICTTYNVDANWLLGLTDRDAEIFIKEE